MAVGHGPYGLQVCFAFKATNTTKNEAQLALYGSADENHPFPALFISHYSSNCALPTTGWQRVCVPIVDLLPPVEPSGGPTPPGRQCSDVGPDHWSCAQQKAWNKCDQSWMKGHCCKTCHDCKGEGCEPSDSDKFTIVKVEFKANYATGVGSFGLDQVEFST